MSAAAMPLSQAVSRDEPAGFGPRRTVLGSESEHGGGHDMNYKQRCDPTWNRLNKGWQKHFRQHTTQVLCTYQQGKMQTGIPKTDHRPPHRPIELTMDGTDLAHVALRTFRCRTCSIDHQSSPAMHSEYCHLPPCACVARPNLMPGRSRIAQKLGRMIMIVSATWEISHGFSILHRRPEAASGAFASSSRLHRVFRFTRGETLIISPIWIRRRRRRETRS